MFCEKLANTSRQSTIDSFDFIFKYNMLYVYSMTNNVCHCILENVRKSRNKETPLTFLKRFLKH